MTILLRLFATSVGLLLALPASAGFRGLDWGSAPAAALASESAAPFAAHGNELRYLGQLGNIKVSYSFQFRDGELVAGQYLNRQNHQERAAYLADQIYLKSLLIKKYDKPQLDEVRWFRDRYRDDPEKLPLAIATAQATMITEWQTADTLIRLTLSGGRMQLQQTVRYLPLAPAATPEPPTSSTLDKL